MWCFKINKRIDETAVQSTAVAAVQQIPAVNSAEGGGNIADRVPKNGILFLLVFFITAAGLFAKGNVDSETAKAYFEIAQAYTEVSKYDKAAEFYLKAAKDPAHKNAAEYNLARVYGLQGDWGKAKNILERQYKDAPGNVLIAKAYAYSLAATGDEARACEMYKKLYDDDSENPEAALNYVRILILSKRYNQALSFIEEMKTRFTENSENKAFAELEEKIKKAQEEPDKQKKQEKETQDENAQTQGDNGETPDTNDTAVGTQNPTESSSSNSKTEQETSKTADEATGTVKDKVSQTKPPTNSEKAKVDDGKKK
ncbi:lipopolysaccharide assembly protein LapB [Treponema sp. OMZ 857]|uniref:tetratricopeptide repeat protein n=1 Tax=Treponema sp. OMZ 857 TaxID=1643513 RepID=UPI0020A5DB8D|nr:tetratricopeptide repeat protein [Treponema sp. OMZ 857]UTC44505.1 tetratricopeptide repeat protein [Treponema sp. OMZ 857]